MPEPLVQLNQIIPNVSPLATYYPVSGTVLSTTLGQNKNRRGIMFSFDGTGKCFVAPAGTAIVSGQGLCILPDAAPIFLANDNFQFNCDVQAICSGGSGTLTIFEFV